MNLLVKSKSVTRKHRIISLTFKLSHAKIIDKIVEPSH